MAGGDWSDLDRPPLDARALRQSLRVGEPDSWWRSVDVVAGTQSTNADLADAARGGAGEATALIAEHQQDGRGRLGRRWYAPPRAALTLSVLVRPAVRTTRWSWLPLLAGVAVAEAVTRSTGLETGMKWPNDVVVDDRKLAGVLLERLEVAAGPVAIVGIGLNVSLRRDELPAPTATSIGLETGAPVDRQPLVLTLLRTLESLYRAWSAAEGDSARGLQASYVRRCTTLGRSVQLALPDGTTVRGVAEAIDSRGRLVLGTTDGRRTLAAGDVVHVRAVV